MRAGAQSRARAEGTGARSIDETDNRRRAACLHQRDPPDQPIAGCGDRDPRPDGELASQTFPRVPPVPSPAMGRAGSAGLSLLLLLAAPHLLAASGELALVEPLARGRSLQAQCPSTSYPALTPVRTCWMPAGGRGGAWGAEVRRRAYEIAPVPPGAPQTITKAPVVDLLWVGADDRVRRERGGGEGEGPGPIDAGPDL